MSDVILSHRFLNAYLYLYTHRNASTGSLGSLVEDVEERELLRASFVRLVIGQLAQQLMFNDASNDEDDCNVNGTNADDEQSDSVDQ